MGVFKKQKKVETKNSGLNSGLNSRLGARLKSILNRKKLKPKAVLSWCLILAMCLTISGTGLGGGVALAANSDSKVIDSTKKQETTALAKYLNQGMTVGEAQALLAKGDFLGDSLLVKVEIGETPKTADLQNGLKQTISGSKELLALDKNAENPGTWYKLDLKKPAAKADLAALMSSLSQNQKVLSVSPNYKITVPKTIDEAAAKESGAKFAPPTKKGNGIQIDDTTFYNQAYLNDYGITQGWDILTKQGITPGQGVVVAVVDSGVDCNHPDLKDQILRKPDGSVWGYNFSDDNNSLEDTVSHGTHVAGIIAAQHNDFGTVGISYGAKIMPVKVIGDNGSGSYATVIEGIKYAVVQGADVINLSLGGGAIDQAAKDILDFCNDSNVIVVCAAGNAGASLSAINNAPEFVNTAYAPYYSAIGVMAEAEFPRENGDRLAYFSNWDNNPNDESEYNLMAPGENIFSTCPDNTYRFFSGTSMAAPVVSGMAACLISYVNRNGIEGHLKYSDEEKHDYVFSQIAGSGDFEQGITYNTKYSFRQADLEKMLQGKTTPQLAVIDYDTTFIQGIAEEIRVKLFNYHGTASDIKAVITSKTPGVTVSLDTSKNNAVNQIVDADDLELNFKVVVNGDLPMNSTIPVELAITYKNGKNSQDSRVYSLSKAFEINYFKAEVLTQSKLDELSVLDNSKLWIVGDNLLVKQGKSLKMTAGCQLLFLEKGALDVAGKLDVRGMIADPVYIISWGQNSMLTETQGGVINTDYLLINNPYLVASQIKHTDVQGSSSDFQQGVIIANQLEYCNFSKSNLNIFADRMEYCQLAGVIGKFNIKNVENNVIIPAGFFDSKNNKAIVGEFVNVSYSLDLAKLTPKIDAKTKKITIAYPAAADEKLDKFLADYVALLGGEIVVDSKTANKAKAKPEGTKIELKLSGISPSTGAGDLQALATAKIFGDKAANGFSTEFFALLTELNSFKNNAVLGFVDFTRDDKLAGNRHQLLLDNYWDLTSQELFDSLPVDEEGAVLKPYYRSYENCFKAKNNEYVFSFLADAPEDIPPFQAFVEFEPNQADTGYYSKLAQAYTTNIYFNTEVMPYPLDVTSFLSPYYSAGQTVAGDWRLLDGKSVWRGNLYFTSGTADLNVSGVSWQQDEWMTIEENNRVSIDFGNPIRISNVKSYANGKTISLKVKADYNERLAEGVYFYRYDCDPKTQEAIDAPPVLMTKEPVFAIETGSNAGMFPLEDSTAELGKTYIYGCAYAADDSEIVPMISSTLANPLSKKFEMKPTVEKTADGKSKIDLVIPAANFYGVGNAQTFKVYYEGDLTFENLVKDPVSARKYLLSMTKGTDQAGKYIQIKLDPAYSMSLFSGVFATLTFSGEGNVTLIAAY